MIVRRFNFLLPIDEIATYVISENILVGASNCRCKHINIYIIILRYLPFFRFSMLCTWLASV